MVSYAHVIMQMLLQTFMIMMLIQLSTPEDSYSVAIGLSAVTLVAHEKAEWE